LGERAGYGPGLSGTGNHTVLRESVVKIYRSAVRWYPEAQELTIWYRWTQEQEFISWLLQSLQFVLCTQLSVGGDGNGNKPRTGRKSNRFRAFLVNLIPDEDTRKNILQEMERIRKEQYGEYVEQHAGLHVVSHMITFLCNSFDLLHFDIAGPATSKQYRDAVLEIPDMKPIGVK
jgi:hypothetical protein